MSDLDSSSETPDTDSTAEDWPVLNDGEVVQMIQAVTGLSGHQIDALMASIPAGVDIFDDEAMNAGLDDPELLEALGFYFPGRAAEQSLNGRYPNDCIAA